MDLVSIIIGAAAVGAIVFFFRKPIFRAMGLSKAVANEAVRNAEQAQAVAMQQQRIDDAAEEVNGLKAALATGGALVNTLRAEVKEDKGEVQTLEGKCKLVARRLVKAKAAAEGGDESAQALVATLIAKGNELGGKLDAAKKKLALHEQQLEAASDNFAKQTKRLQAINKKVNDAQGTLDDKRDELEMAKFNAQASEALSSVKVGTGSAINSLDQGFDDVDRLIHEQNAKATVADAMSEEDDLDAELEAELGSLEGEGTFAQFLEAETAEAGA